ncbi:MAG: adenosylcobinamide-phosphate synthase CbiB [Wujia sp.]
MLQRAGIIAIAFVLDMVLGDPHFLWHPVRGIGRLIEYTEKLLRRLLKISEDREADINKKRVAGVIIVLVVISFSVAIPVVILYFFYRLNRWFGFGVECVMCYQLLAMRSLCVESMPVYRRLKENDLDGARKSLSMIVGRDTDRLDEQGIIRATVETVAENTSDGVIAPLIFMFILGTAGGWLYKAINTMDSMIGYKNDRYIYLGTAAAKLDDIVNFIPARVAGLIMVLSAFMLGLDGKNAWRVFHRDRRKHASPNSAQTEAACAGALGVRLAGNAYYFGRLYEKPYIGDALRPIDAVDIKRANRLMYTTSIITLLIGLGILLIISAFG